MKISYADLQGVLQIGDQTLERGKDFTIKGYSSNTKKGTAKVTVAGCGAIAGRKTLTFKIVTKKVDYQGALVGGEWR